MGPSYVHPLLWGLTLVHKMVPVYNSLICFIMGPSYVHRLLWGLTLVHKMVPIQFHTYYYGSILCSTIIVLYRYELQKLYKVVPVHIQNSGIAYFLHTRNTNPNPLCNSNIIDKFLYRAPFT